MGRIHDALKKAEEERRKKRAEKEQATPSASEREAPSMPVKKSKPAKKPAPTEELPVTRKSPRMDEPEPYRDTVAQKKPKKGIAAGLKRRETQESAVEHPANQFGELLLSWHAPTDQRSEQIRSLRTNLLNLDPSPLVTAFVSSVGDEGASMTAANLAVSFAEDKSQSILLVDANLRSSSLEGFFDVSGEAPGFKEILEGKFDPDQAVVESGVPHLYFVGAGGEVDNPGALLSTKEINRVLNTWRRRFDRILMVLPPVTDANDAAVIGREVDGAVMVIKLGSTPRRETEHALDSLAHSGVRVLGCVVTNTAAAKENSPGKS